jgi:8-amino-7-oxononanoate synthase
MPDSQPPATTPTNDNAPALAKALAKLSGRAHHNLAVKDAKASRRYLPPPPPAIERDFASNDYLGLAHHSALISAAHEFAQHYGVGARASRLVTGNLSITQDLETRLAKSLGAERVLLMNSGFSANSGAIAALLHPGLHPAGPPQIFADRLIHASLHQGLKLSGHKVSWFQHNDLSHLEQLLKTERQQAQSALILTETVFSMDGDGPDLSTLYQLARSYEAILYLDEAHACGLYGPHSLGLGNAQEAIIMGTFGKALGAYGAFLALPEYLADWLVNRCASFIYATALPPPIIGAVMAALDLLPSLGPARTRLQNSASTLRQALVGLGYPLLGEGAILPLLIGDNSRTLALAGALGQYGFRVGAIRPPTVPIGGARLRLTVSAAHKKEDIDTLIAAFSTTEIRTLARPLA